jgi:hypothetical protein
MADLRAYNRIVSLANRLLNGDGTLDAQALLADARILYEDGELSPVQVKILQERVINRLVAITGSVSA